MENEIKIENILDIEKNERVMVYPYERRTYTLLKSDYDRFHAFNGSFGNCQNITINSFKNIINNIETYEKLKTLLFYVKNQFGGRSIIIADIKKDRFDKLLKIIDSQEIIDKIFIMKNEYESTNGSKMVLIMINTKNL